MNVISRICLYLMGNGNDDISSENSKIIRGSSLYLYLEHSFLSIYFNSISWPSRFKAHVAGTVQYTYIPSRRNGSGPLGPLVGVFYVQKDLKNDFVLLLFYNNARIDLKWSHDQLNVKKYLE